MENVEGVSILMILFFGGLEVFFKRNVCKELFVSSVYPLKFFLLIGSAQERGGGGRNLEGESDALPGLSHVILHF